MKDILRVTIVPRYGCINASARKLEELTGYTDTKYILHQEPIAALIAEIPDGDLAGLAKLKDFVDIIAVKSLDTVLDDEFMSLDSSDLGLDSPLTIYSPTARVHSRGKMSNGGRSSAQYHWEIFRPEEPSNGAEPVCLLLQSIPSGGLTSRHHHERTEERFLSLAGEAEISLQNGKEPVTYSASKGYFFRVGPKVEHQLRTSSRPVVNVLYMNPYDPELKDHHYK